MSLIALFNHIVALVAAHPVLAYAAAGVATFFEALALVGVFFPGSMLVLGLGALVPSGALALIPLTAATAAGASAGDAVSYVLGRRYRQGILRLWPLRTHPRWIARGRLLFRRHGSKSIFMARFVRGAHAMVPLLAGVMRMAFVPFMAMNIASAALWAPIHVMLGVAVGASLALASAVAGRLALFVAVLGGTLFLIVWGVRRLLLWGVPRLSALEARLNRWAAANTGRRARLVRSLLDPRAGELRGLIALLIILLAASWLFFGVLQDLLSGDPLVRADVAVYHLMQSLRTSWADQLMIRVTELGDAFVVLAVAGSVTAWLVWKRAWRTVVHWVSAVTLAEVLTFAIKITLRVPRPQAVYHGWHSFSFPSGHATVNTTVYALLAYLVVRELRPRWQGWVIAGVAVLITLIDVSRLYLGVHWLADVAAGSALALMLVAALAIGYRHHSPPRVGGGSLLGVAAAALVVFGVWHSTAQYRQDVSRYAVHEKHVDLLASDWWRGQWRQLAARRIDLVGGHEVPLTVQWAGRLSRLRTRLAAAGWQVPAAWSFDSALQWLSPHSTATQLPVLPQMNDGDPATLVLIRPAGASGRLVLRLWRSNVRLDTRQGAQVPVWLGTAVRQTLTHPYALFSLVRAEPGVNGPRQVLAGELVHTRVGQRARAGKHHAWDGRVLLAHPGGLKLR